MHKKIIRGVISALLLFILIINIPIIQLFHEETTIDYSNWMKENVPNEMKVTDITMLGAHDAYSSDISITSDVDAYETGIASTAPGFLLKGLLVKQSKTQITDTAGLMKNGVRYLDIRLSYSEGEFYTKHSYVSTNFKSIAEDLVEYLRSYDGELLVLDFQHIDGLDYGNDEDYHKFYDMLDTYGLEDYLYNSDNGPLSDITYGAVTNDKTQSGIVIIDKFTDSTKQTYHYDQSVRSTWADNDDFESTVSFLNEEATLVKGMTEYDNMFKVTQGVTTMQMDAEGVKNGLMSWSLVERAEDFNLYLIESEEFDTILDSLPIIMVDYANSNENGFVDEIMKKIIEKNTVS